MRKPLFTYFISKGSSLNEMELFIHVEILKIEFKINEKTIRNGLSKNRVGESHFWSHLEFPDGIWINYDYIPKITKHRNGLPLIPSAAYEQLKRNAVLKEDLYRDAYGKILFENMKKFYTERWPCFVKEYSQLFKEKRIVQLYAMTHALFNYLLEEEKKGESLKTLFEYYKRIINEDLSKRYNLIFVTQNYYSFLRKIRQAKSGIRNSLVHKSKGVKRNDFCVLTENDRSYVKLLKANPKNYTSRNIQEMLLEERGIYVSRETIRKLFSDSYTRNICLNFSKGSSYTRKNGRPTIKRIFKFPGDQYQGDGSKLQFLCVDHMGKIITLTYYVILDAYSKKVVGFSVDTSENSEMIINAFNMAFNQEGALPKEILVDNGSGYKNQEAKKFIRNVQHFGVVWKFCHKDYPLEKAEVESFFSGFQKKVCTRYDNYIGEGVKTKNVYGNPAAELNKLYWSKKRFLPSIDELKIELFNMIKKYNNEYYKEYSQPVNSVSNETEKEHDPVGSVHDLKVVLA